MPPPAVFLKEYEFKLVNSWKSLSIFLETFYFIQRNFLKKSWKDLSQLDFQNDDWNCTKKTLLPFSSRVKGRLSESVWLCVFCRFLHTFKQELCILSMDWIGVGSADTGVHHLPLISKPQWLSDQYFEAICAGVNEMYSMVSGIWIIGPQLVLLFGQALQVWPWWYLSLEVVESWKDMHHCQFTLCCYLRLKVPALSFPAQASLPSPRCIVVIEKYLIQKLIPRDVLLLWQAWPCCFWEKYCGVLSQQWEVSDRWIFLFFYIYFLSLLFYYWVIGIIQGEIAYAMWHIYHLQSGLKADTFNVWWPSVLHYHRCKK